MGLEITEQNRAVLRKMESIRKKHLDCMEQYEAITKSCSKILMSKNKKVSIYGMFVPDKNIEYYVTQYVGKLTNNERNKDFKYFFDEQDRILLTERYCDGELRNIIFYYYFQDHVEFIMTNVCGNYITSLGNIEYKENQIDRLIISDVHIENQPIDSYTEIVYDFSKEQLMLTRNNFGILPGGRIINSSKTHKAVL